MAPTTADKHGPGAEACAERAPPSTDRAPGTRAARRLAEKLRAHERLTKQREAKASPSDGWHETPEALHVPAAPQRKQQVHKFCDQERWQEQGRRLMPLRAGRRSKIFALELELLAE
jgi:hypothetical protein